MATCTTSSLTLGSHSLTASYAGDANNASSVSPVLIEVIKQAPQLLLEALPNPATVTAPVTLKLTASAGSGTPTGSVSFLDGASVLGTGLLNSQGIATITTAQLVPGNHALTAQYAGDTSNAAGTSNTVNALVQQASTATTLAADQATAPVGTTFVLTAQVNSVDGPAPTGSVSFAEGSSTLGVGALISGQAAISLNSLPPGVHNFVATYIGDTDSAPSSSHPIAVTVTQIATGTTLNTDINPLSAGAVLHLNATVALSPGATTAGAMVGTVSFMEGGRLLGTDVLDANGHATLAVPGLSVGPHSFTAVYSGATNYAGSTSAVVSEAVAQTATSVSLNASTATSLSGKVVTFNVVVASSTGAPTGTVTLHEGSNTFGQASVTPNGTASFTVASLTVGSHVLVATYLGDANYSTSNSAGTPVAVALGQPILSLSGPAAPINVTVEAGFTATLTSTGVSPTGTLTLHDASAIVATQNVTTAGVVTFTTDALALGTHNLTVSYSGDANTASTTSSGITVVVQQAPSTIVLTAGPNPVTLGSPLHLRTIVSSSSPHLSGTITFQEGTASLGSAGLGTDGSASLDLTSLAPGVHLLTALYSGDAIHASSGAPTVSVRVVYPVVAVLSSSSNPAISGTTVTLRGQISPGSTNTNGSLPTGPVSFFSDGASLGTVTLDGSGVASVSTKDLAVGVHNLLLSYAGDANFASGAATLVQAITNASTQVALKASANPATYGTTLTLSAIVQSNGGPATGTVLFSDGTTTLGRAPLDSQGLAQLTLSSLRPGTRSIAASYEGDGKASASVSAPLSLVVKQTTSVTLASSSNPSLTLNGILFTATVQNAGASTPAGAVTFYDGPNAIGTVQLDSNGQASLAVQQMSAGTHPISASYAGDENDYVSAQPGTLTEVVDLRSTTTALTSSSTDVSDPQKVTLIAVVHGEGNIPPSGTVSFQSGATLVGTSRVDSTGVATLTIELEVKQENITASYGGDAAYSGSSSANATVVAGAATQFSISVSPGVMTIISKDHGLVLVTLQSVKGFNDTLKLGCLGLPFAATCTFSTPQVKLDADGTSVVQLTIDTGNPLGAGAEVSAQRSLMASRVLVCMTPLGLLALAWRGRGRRILSPLLLLLVSIGMVVGLSGCGGLQVVGTPAGAYTFKVTASGVGSGATQSQTVSLTVNQ